MIAGILQEPAFENRVSLLPEQAEQLAKKNIQVWVEKGAGTRAFMDDNAYVAKQVQVKNRQEIVQQADIILAIHPPTLQDISVMKKNCIIIGVYQPFNHAKELNAWNSQSPTVFSLDFIPRTTRAQSMDVLSSQANIAGYKAVLYAATTFPRYFPMFMTAAGSIPPAKVLILGAGVAGLQAIATARRLGAVVEVFDTRPAVKEEVMSLGAKFVEVEGAADASKAGGYAVEQSEEYKQKQQQKIAESVAKADIVITTAQIPGKKAPILITEAMLQSMKNGSVIIDLASATGGNTPFTKNNEQITTNNGVIIVGNSNLQSTMPLDASKMYGKNVINFMQLLFNKQNELIINFDDDIVKGCCLLHNGSTIHEKIIPLI